MHNVRRGNRPPSSQKRRNSSGHTSSNSHRRPFTQNTNNTSPKEEARVLTLDEIKERARQRKEREAALAAASSTKVVEKGKPALYPSSSSNDGESPGIAEVVTSRTPEELSARESVASDQTSTPRYQRRVRIDRRRVEPANLESSINSEPSQETSTAVLQSSTLRIQAPSPPNCENKNIDVNMDSNRQNTNDDVDMAEAPPLLEQQLRDGTRNTSDGTDSAAITEITSSNQPDADLRKNRPSVGNTEGSKFRSSNKEEKRPRNSEKSTNDANKARAVGTTEGHIPSNKSPRRQATTESGAERFFAQHNEPRKSSRHSRDMARGRSPTRRNLNEDDAAEIRPVRENSNSSQGRQRMSPANEIRLGMRSDSSSHDKSSVIKDGRSPSRNYGYARYPSGQRRHRSPAEDRSNTDETNATSERRYVTGKRHRSDTFDGDSKSRVSNESPSEGRGDCRTESGNDRNDPMEIEREDQRKREIQPSTRNGQQRDGDRSVDDRNFEAYEHERALIARRKKMRLDSDANSVGGAGNDSTWKNRLGTSRPHTSEQATEDSRSRSQRPRISAEDETEAKSFHGTKSRDQVPNKRGDSSYEQDEETGWGHPVPKQDDSWESSNVNSMDRNAKGGNDRTSSPAFRNRYRRASPGRRQSSFARPTGRVEMTDKSRRGTTDASYEQDGETGWGRPLPKQDDSWNKSNANSTMDRNAKNDNDRSSTPAFRNRSRTSPNRGQSPFTRPTGRVEVTDKSRRGMTDASNKQDEEIGWGRPLPKQDDLWKKANANSTMDWNANNGNDRASTSVSRNSSPKPSPGRRQSVTRLTGRVEMTDKSSRGLTDVSIKQDEETGWGRPIPKQDDTWEKPNATSAMDWNANNGNDRASLSVSCNGSRKPSPGRRHSVTRPTGRVEVTDKSRRGSTDASYKQDEETGWGRPIPKQDDSWEQQNTNSTMDWNAKNGNDRTSSSVSRNRSRKPSPGRGRSVTRPTERVEVTDQLRRGTTDANYKQDEESGWGRPTPKQDDSWESSNANSTMDWIAENTDNRASSSVFRNRSRKPSLGRQQFPDTRSTGRSELRDNRRHGPMVNDRLTFEKDTSETCTGISQERNPLRSSSPAKKAFVSGQNTRSRIREAVVMESETPSRTTVHMSTPGTGANSKVDCPASETYQDRRSRRVNDRRALRRDSEVDSARVQNQHESTDRRTSHAAQSIDRNTHEERFGGGHESRSSRRQSMPPPMDLNARPLPDRLGQTPEFRRSNREHAAHQHQYPESGERENDFCRRNRSDIVSEGQESTHQAERRIPEKYQEYKRGFGRERAHDNTRGTMNHRDVSSRSGVSSVRGFTNRRDPYPDQRQELPASSPSLPSQGQLFMEREERPRGYNRRRPASPSLDRRKHHDQQEEQSAQNIETRGPPDAPFRPHRRTVGDGSVGIPDRLGGRSQAGRGYPDRRRSTGAFAGKRDVNPDRTFSPNNGDRQQERRDDRQQGDSRRDVRSTSSTKDATGTNTIERRGRSDVRREGFRNSTNSTSARSRSPFRSSNPLDRRRSRSTSRERQSTFSRSRVGTEEGKSGYSTHYRSPTSSRVLSRSDSLSGPRTRTTTRSGTGWECSERTSRERSAGPISERGWNDRDPSIAVRNIEVMEVDVTGAAPEDKTYPIEAGTQSAEERDPEDEGRTTDVSVSEHREFFETKLQELRERSDEFERGCTESNRMTFSELVHLIGLVPSAVKMFDRYTATVYDANGVIADLAGLTACAEQILGTGIPVDVALALSSRSVVKGKIDGGDADSASEVLSIGRGVGAADGLKEGRETRKVRLFKKEVAKHVVSALKPGYFEDRMGTKDQFKNISKAFTDQLMDLYTFSDDPVADWRSEGTQLPVVSSEALPEVVRNFVKERLSVVEMMNKKPFREDEKEGEDDGLATTSWNSGREGRQSGETGSAVSSIDFSADAFRGNHGEKGRVVR